MHILFVDESGSPPPEAKAADTPYFVLGGIVIPEDQWTNVAADLKRAKALHGIVGEVKWRYFAPQKPGSKPHAMSHLTPDEKEDLRTKIYSLISAYKSVRLICVVVNVIHAYRANYINSPDDLYQYSYKVLTERFQYYLQDLERTIGNRVNGIVVCDHRGPKDDERLRELHQRLLTGGRDNYSTYSNMIEGLFIAPSHLSVGIQLADMVAGAVYRAIKSNDWRYFEQVKGAFRTSPAGKLEGYGLAKFPSGW